ncbi:hypothetical protein GWI33_020284 [Rhynchophorus ferrugineus]|uniref:Uncharacterized protein n=1 Tax=Rhynchophorus ferrugineus TaxID=354439 RepID=A0A834M4D1_RHYFE|nr:hypothetical protein GWI33_020284 [Rhynchophorus ferrugineus]
MIQILLRFRPELYYNNRSFDVNYVKLSNFTPRKISGRYHFVYSFATNEAKFLEQDLPGIRDGARGIWHDAMHRELLSKSCDYDSSKYYTIEHGA